MDRAAIAREGRRAQALEALQFERDRETALLAQVSEIVLEEDGDGIDREAFERLSPQDVARVRNALGTGDEVWEQESSGEDESFFSFESDADEEPDVEGELGRLELEIAECRARQRALELYVQALAGETQPAAP